MGIKKIATDQDTRKILLSHTRSDQKLNNIIYGLLLLNGFKNNEIIYTSDPENRSGVPYGSNVFDYLREFFIQSYSQKQIYVLYIYSNKTCKLVLVGLSEPNMGLLKLELKNQKRL